MEERLAEALREHQLAGLEHAVELVDELGRDVAHDLLRQVAHVMLARAEDAVDVAVVRELDLHLERSMLEHDFPAAQDPAPQRRMEPASVPLAGGLRRSGCRVHAQGPSRIRIADHRHTRLSDPGILPRHASRVKPTAGDTSLN